MSTQMIDAIQNEFSKEVAAKYLGHVLDIEAEVAESKFLATRNGIGIIPQAEVLAFKGKAKMGKSQFEYFLVGALLGRNAQGIKPAQEHYKILLFDTEQSQTSLKKCCQRALRFAGLPDNKNDYRFLPFYLRPLSIEDRKETIVEAIKQEQPDIIFIDGIRDLLHDFNDLKESNEIIQWLLQLTAEYACTIVCVLHQNKGKDDGNMRGHLGTELLNKLAECYEVSKKDGKFYITCTDSRNVPCDDFAFSIDADGNYKEESLISKVNDERIAKIQRILKLCFEKQFKYGYNELRSAYALEAAVSESTARRAIAEAKDNDYIIVENGKYQLNPHNQ
jgi:hypothetical protein